MDIKKLEELRKCHDDFVYFCENYIKIHHPKKGLIPLTLYPYQKRLIDTYNNDRFVILTKFRQGGFSTISAFWALWQCLFRQEKNIMIGSCNDRMVTSFYKNFILPALHHLPEWMCQKLGKNNMHHIHFEWTDCNLYFYTLEPARGKRLDALIIDGAAYIPNMENKWKCVYPCFMDEGKCFVLSTPNKVGNWFHDTYTNAVAGKNAFKVFHADYIEHPDYNNEKWAEEVKKCLGEAGWQQEVLQNFLGQDTLQ